MQEALNTAQVLEAIKEVGLTAEIEERTTEDKGHVEPDLPGKGSSRKA
jgi:hypothetical protein